MEAYAKNRHLNIKCEVPGSGKACVGPSDMLTH